MRTPFSEMFHKGLVSSLEKAGTSEGAERGWKTRKGELPPVEDTPGEERKPAADETPAEGHRPGRTEVFAAALRGFHGDMKTTRSAHENNERIQQLGEDLGEVGEDFAADVLGAIVGEVKVGEKNRAIGAWFETDEAGEKVPVSEPSFHSVVEGEEREVLRRAAALGLKYGQEAVAVAIHDPAAEGRVFTIAFSEGAGDEAVETAIAHFLAAGLGGATGMTDRPALRLLATSADEAEVIERALADLPGDYEATSESRPARVRFLVDSEYEELITGKEAAADGETVVAEVIIGGVRRRSSELGQ